MPPRPHVQPLSKKSRTIIFILSVLLFTVSMPLFVLYAIGYRLDLAGDTQNFRTVGGMYISTEADGATIFVDEEEVEDMRLFQQAAYVQNLYAGLHRIHTQGPSVQTWVKELPVYPHLVTQAASFNMPATSTVRFIAPFVSATGTPLYIVDESKARPFLTTVREQEVRFTTTDAAVAGANNPEWEFIDSLFASTTAKREVLAEQAALNEQEFSFTPLPMVPTTTASTTRLDGDYRLYQEADDVYVEWTGDVSDIPYYFCVFTNTYASTSAQYGQHVADQLFVEKGATYTLASTTIEQNRQLCRPRIRIDRKWQEVVWYEFMPNDPNLVLLQLQDGLYVVEADDRSWQNVQQLYAGDDVMMLINGSQIFLRDEDIYFELLVEPIGSSN